MRKERKPVKWKCPNCDHKFVSPLRLFRLPGDLPLLAESLEMPAETITALLDRGTIPVRRAVDKNGRRYGPLLVWLVDAYAAISAMHALRS